MKLPAKKLLLTLFSLFFFLASPANAAWVVDPEITNVGKAAERARQLLFWFFSRPSLDNSPAIQSMWVVSRNIAFVLFIVIIVGLGFQLILSKEKPKFEAMLPKIAMLLLFSVFSYVLVLGLIQIGDLTMNFFIKKVAGENLFNITFVGGNIESNYTNFTGYKESGLENVESITTSLFLIKATTFTYNVIFIALVLRKIILWFLLIVSPFLPLLFAFPLTKNVSWVWIGVFFQWLFYGPLFSLFLSGLVKIWIIGIPFSFDFSRAGKQEGQIYKTAINILYGGPAQSLSTLNSANYVDTYAEYAIGLIMLWVVILLPWLLLRTFRDYCCEILKSVEGAIWNLYYKTAGPAAPSTPSVSSIAKLDLSLKKLVSQAIPSYQPAKISQMETREILNTVGLKVSTLADVSQFDIDTKQRQQANQQLEYLHSPAKNPVMAERTKFSTINKELTNRTTKGDVSAERILTAASGASPNALIRLMEKPKVEMPAAKERMKAGFLPISITTAPPRKVSVEDYEEVKKMWIKNYREGDIPISDKIKSREDWLGSELARISDTVEMLSSKDEETRKRGWERVSAILPFLLLGGFNEEQTIVYLKAKLEAVKLVQEQLTQMEKIKQEAKKEGEFVEVERPVREELKEAELEKSLKLEPDKKV